MPKEPMIVIKKSDGTTVRMPLSQFREQKGIAKSSVPSGSKKPEASASGLRASVSPKSVTPLTVVPRTASVAPPKPVSMPRREQKLAHTGMADMKKTPAKTASWDDEDHKSLLDESLHTDLPMIVEKDPLHLKQAIQAQKSASPAIQQSNVAGKKEEKGPNSLEKTQTPKIPLSKEPYVWRPTSAANMKDRVGKPVMHDVRPSQGSGAMHTGEQVNANTSLPQSKIMGPADELGTLTIQDFRRFGSTVGARAETLATKFSSLQKESFLLYVKGLTAWRQSPLYRMYIDIIQTALNGKQTIDGVLARNVQKDDLTKEELVAIITLNAKVRI